MWGIFGQIEFYKMQRFWFFPDPYSLLLGLHKYSMYIFILHMYLYPYKSVTIISILPYSGIKQHHFGCKVFLVFLLNIDEIRALHGIFSEKSLKGLLLLIEI